MRIPERVRSAAALAAAAFCAFSVRPQDAGPAASRVALFSSGVGYFEYSGTVRDDAAVDLVFRTEDVNDALKSLVVYAGAEGGSPSLTYHSRIELSQALKAFSVDLSGFPSVPELLSRAIGAELSVRSGGSVRVSGRILSVEARPEPRDGAVYERPYLALLSPAGVVALPLDEIESFAFDDPAREVDFRRALEAAAAARDTTRTAMTLKLPGTGTRRAVFGYVIEAPVWKASYRLDLSGDSPFIQGWAVVDNATDRDWRGVELSLVSGRPVSFIQELYAPLRVRRPVVPLSIAGSAAPRSYAGGIAADEALVDGLEEAEAEAAAPAMMERAASAAAPAPAPSAKSLAARNERISDAPFEPAAARIAGDLFEYTLPGAVTLERGRSALLPLLSGPIRARRVSVYTAGSSAAALGARVENSTSMKLPAGPITVFDGGSYAGDALIDFLPPGDERLISFGEDLDLRAKETAATSAETVSVGVAKGVLVFSRRVAYEKTYAFRNLASRGKTIVVEHPITPETELSEPRVFMEKADGRYRFSVEAAAGSERKLTVVEKRNAAESVSLLPLGAEAYLRWASSKEIPESVKAALARAAELRREWDDAAREQRALSSRRGALASDQARIRANLEAIGRDSSEGKKYLKRLLDAESELDKTDERAAEAGKAVEAAQAAYERYVSSLIL